MWEKRLRWITSTSGIFHKSNFLVAWTKSLQDGQCLEEGEEDEEEEEEEEGEEEEMEEEEDVEEEEEEEEEQEILNL